MEGVLLLRDKHEGVWNTVETSGDCCGPGLTEAGPGWRGERPRPRRTGMIYKTVVSREW